MTLTVIAVAGAILTILACVRMLMALVQRKAPEIVAGWFAVMIAPPIVVLGIARLTG